MAPNERLCPGKIWCAVAKTLTHLAVFETDIKPAQNL